MSLRPNQRYMGGENVWARVGSCGWSPAIVVRVGRKYLRVHFPERPAGGRRFGIRSLEELLPRNPKLNGKDRPAPDRSGEMVSR